ncbi:MAG: hypothetical protein ACK455_00015 [Bacteroidota bacterium]|jgi:hypothetical protein
MKNVILLLTLSFSLLNFANAQTPPNAFNYSAVARNAAGQPIATTTIGIQVTILKTSPTGASQYSENHFVNTDAYGLFNLVIGAGAVQSGSMASIDWSNDNYYLKVGMDAAGGTNFLTMGTTQLLSVPYALYAKSAGTVAGGGTGGGFTHYIGEEFGGGVIFHLWKDSQGNEHGLIVDKTDLSSSQVWSNVDQVLVGENAQSSFDGLSNSNAIVNQIGHTSSAAALCLNSTNGGQNDWYLPSMHELNKLWQNSININKTLQIIGGTHVMSYQLNDFGNSIFTNQYWSSSETGAGSAAFFNTYFGNTSFVADGGLNKNIPRYVRAIRSF